MALALRTVQWRNDFAKLGIPNLVWEALVKDYENEALSHGGKLSEAEDEAAILRIASALNRHRQANSHLPKFVVEGGCGAGEIEVRIELRPQDGRLFLIPTFLFKLCQVQNLNPTDPKVATAGQRY